MLPGSDNQLKLIAIVLPEPLFSFVKHQQLYIAETWDCRMALRTPPHITVIPPLSIRQDEWPELESIVFKASEKGRPFTLEVTGFDAFKPRVIFLKTNLPKELVKLYTDLRNRIEMKLPHLLYRYPDRTFTPHITLAYRDVEPEQFREIWNYYKDQKALFKIHIDRLSLLNNIDKKWKLERDFLLSDK